MLGGHRVDGRELVLVAVDQRGPLARVPGVPCASFQERLLDDGFGLALDARPDTLVADLRARDRRSSPALRRSSSGSRMYRGTARDVSLLREADARRRRKACAPQTARRGTRSVIRSLHHCSSGAVSIVGLIPSPLPSSPKRNTPRRKNTSVQRATTRGARRPSARPSGTRHPRPAR